ncbi:hypothetical protein NOV72_01427 [Caballeronia novacaledonica]|uniref:Uncharacterized protein n=1 Tax=Caballeronia novacaledonica TaxID=1544861 RepID=A0A2U3I234_9BURK|nr:hypothetical protein [Caballeronia novacaledonica]SPB14178.1 hypothetical protein NOV72_01427 [Caballeronia novacaledonica]
MTPKEVEAATGVDPVITIRKSREFDYRSIPTYLLEDWRLSLDSRAVASWLAGKENGWEVRIGPLRHILGINGNTRWSRIARELIAAGYLNRSRYQNARGHWRWAYVFSLVPPVPPHEGLKNRKRPAPDGEREAAENLFSELGQSELGTSAFGKSARKQKQQNTKAISNNNTTKNRFSSFSDLIFESEAQPHRAIFREVFGQFDPIAHSTAQQIVDEFVANARNGKAIADVKGWVRSLVERALGHQPGEKFSPKGGLAVASARSRRALVNEAIRIRDAAREKRSAAERAAIGLPASQAGPDRGQLDRLIRNGAEKKRNRVANADGDSTAS